MNLVLPATKALIIDGDQFLIIKQVIDDLVVWDLPGGRIKYGEAPLDTLRREVKEETDLDITVEKIAGVWWFYRSASDKNQVVCITYLCSVKNGQIDLGLNPDAKEEIISEYKWITKNEFLTNDYPVGHESLKQLINDVL